jgi:HNH endonuclease
MSKPKSSERLEQVSITNTVPANQTYQTPHLKGLFVTSSRTYLHEDPPKPLGYYEISCKRCKSMRTTKCGKLINVYQRCVSCHKLLGIPSNAKSQGISTKECTSCGKVNDVRLFQRWRCVDCGLSFFNPNEVPLINQQKQDPVKTTNDTWSKIRGIILERDDYRCQICGKASGRLDLHHIKPRRDGGQDSTDNLITVCNGACHTKLEPHREKFTISITGKAYHRMNNLVGNVGNDEEKIIRLCEELEKTRIEAYQE